MRAQAPSITSMLVRGTTVVCPVGKPHFEDPDFALGRNRSEFRWQAGYGADFAEQWIANDSHRITELNPLALDRIRPGVGGL